MQKFSKETGKFDKFCGKSESRTNCKIAVTCWRHHKERYLRKDLLFSLLFKVVMILLTYILKYCNEKYRFTSLQEKSNYFMNMDDLNMFDKNKMELPTFM